MKQEICVGDQEGGLRIDKYLAEAAGQLSRSYIQKLLKDGRILVNGKPVKASYVVEDEDILSMDIPLHHYKAPPFSLNYLLKEHHIYLKSLYW